MKKGNKWPLGVPHPPLVAFMPPFSSLACLSFYAPWKSMRGSFAYLKGFEVVDEDIWHPEVVDEVEIDGVQLLHVHGAENG